MYTRSELFCNLSFVRASHAVLLACDMEVDDLGPQFVENGLLFKLSRAHVVDQVAIDHGALDFGSISVELTVLVEHGVMNASLRPTCLSGALFQKSVLLF